MPERETVRTVPNDAVSVAHSRCGGGCACGRATCGMTGHQGKSRHDVANTTVRNTTPAYWTSADDAAKH
eukprot:5883978-Prymnesium_polylepis.1